MGEMGTVRLHTEKFGSPHHLTARAISTTARVSLRYTPEVPKLKKMWVKKEVPTTANGKKMEYSKYVVTLLQW